MKFVSFVLIFLIPVVFPESSFAQLDSSYELLLGNSPVPESSKKKVRAPNQVEPSTKVQPEPAEIPQGRPLPVKLQPTPEEPTYSQQAQSLFAADPEKVFDFYQSQLDESDPRRNKVEISFAPGYVTNESSSNYSFRDYRSVFTGMNLGASVWLTPAMGVGGNFLFSLGADTSGDAVTNTRSPARYEFLDVGLKFRQFFGFSLMSKSIAFDLLFSDYKFNVNVDDIYRARLKSTGVGVKMTLRMPTSPDVAWLVGGSFYPRLQHSETKAGVDVNSGNNTENVRFGIQLGSEVRLSRESQIFYEASLMSEKNLFDGNAKSMDPATNQTPKNVSVTDSYYLFSVGYRWGN